MEGRNGQENEQNAKPNSYLKDGTREEMGSPAAVAADSAGADPAFFFFGDGVGGWGRRRTRTMNLFLSPGRSRTEKVRSGERRRIDRRRILNWIE